jgi:hypothetical protein
MAKQVLIVAAAVMAAQIVGSMLGVNRLLASA